MLSQLALAALLATHLATASASEAKPLQKGQDYIALTNFPNLLHILDLGSDSVYKSCKLPDAFGPGTLRLSPDRSKAFILNNHYGDIYGIELDTCKLVFHAVLSPEWDIRNRAFFSIAVSNDGKEVYTVVSSTKRHRDRLEVLTPKFLVFSADGGLDAKPIRSFDAPRQITLLQPIEDGSLYAVGADVYRMDVRTGKVDTVIPLRNWKRPSYSPPDVLYVWPQNRPQGTFNLFYTAAKFKDAKQDLATADNVYGVVDISLKDGKAEILDFGPVTEVYFSGARSPTDPKLVFGVLNRLAKYDVAQKKLVGAAELDHSYYNMVIDKTGRKAYLGGTVNDIAVYDTVSLQKLKTIRIPGGDMALTSLQLFTR